MGFDMDLHRTASTAFGPASLVAGGVLPYEGRIFVKSTGTQEAAFEARTDGWVGPETPVLVRGPVRIIPLAWLGSPEGSGASPEEIAAFTDTMLSYAAYVGRAWSRLDLEDPPFDGIRPYAVALRDGGATRVDYWMYSEEIGHALVHAGDAEAGTMSLALHLVPAPWLSERLSEQASRRKRSRPIPPKPDLRWSWSEVIALHGARLAADS